MQQLDPNRLFRFLGEVGNEVNDMARAQAQAADLRGRQNAGMQGDLAALLVRAGDHPTPDQARQIAVLQAGIRNAERNEANMHALDNIAITAVGGLTNYAMGALNQQRDIALDANRIRNQGLVENRGALERLKFMTSPETLKWVGGATVVSFISIIGGYYGLKLTYEQIKAHLGIPELVDETSRMSVWQEFVSMFVTKKAEDVKPTDEVILSPEIAATAERIAADTKETNALHLPYQNLLLYGPPGTGKTAFAKVLAHYSEMDYAILSGSRFAQFDSEKAVTELFKIFKWAKDNKRGTIIFIDEADACFRDRKTLDQNGINFVNAFLSETGTSSDKFMFVFASNYENELDSAVLSRIHKKINFALPALPEREKILQQKITKYIVNDQRSYIKNDKKVTETLGIADDVTSAFLQDVAKKIDGFSGRDIDYAVSEMRMRAYRSGSNMLTRNIVETIIKEKIAEVAKDKKTSTYQDQKAGKLVMSVINQANAAA